MAPVPSNLRHIESLVEIVASLRGPNGCPWDKEQTHQSLTQYAIEETHELVEAIEHAPESPDYEKNLKEELGDVLFQVVLHTQLAAERGAFTLEDVIATISEKLVRRHPHVFGDTKVESSEDVIKNWEEIKKKEKATQSKKSPYSIEVPALPALQRAYKIGKRTEKLNFDWNDLTGVMEKVVEEYEELHEALEQEVEAEIEHELGDALFSLAQLGRHLKMEPEQVLRKANQRFETRFNLMVHLTQEDQKDFGALTLEEKETYWQKAKAQLKKK